jgi:hypothetical protein
MIFIFFNINLAVLILFSSYKYPVFISILQILKYFAFHFLLSINTYFGKI